MLRTAKPYVRWWWLGGPFRDADIVFQLDWLKEHGFGGVELAWIQPLWLDPSFRQDMPEWLGTEWSRLVEYTKRYADTIGLGCDFTFGSAWPFGGRCVSPEQSSRRFDETLTSPVSISWESATVGPRPNVLNHLSADALRHYASVLGPAFAPGLRGTTSALFCDSLEIEKRGLWSPQLWTEFEARFGYSLQEVVSELDADPALRYDYRKFIGETIVREFYACFTDVCHELGAVSRVQCHGAPADLLSAYSAADIPESEALLFNPPFSRIAASAAALTHKPVVSCETFTCIYGFPGRGDIAPILYWRKENIADLKVLADAVFANGVNQIVWHGMPFNPPGGNNVFYASVHVGPDAAFIEDLKPFNAYLERVSGALKAGAPVCRLAVYLPNEDYMRAGELPREGRVPGEQDAWEMRGVEVPAETEGFHPLWVSAALLKRAEVKEGRLAFDDVEVSGLYVASDWLDADALLQILRLARAGLPIALPRTPQEPGRRKSHTYAKHLEDLRALQTVAGTLGELPVSPLLEGEALPWFWARENHGGLTLFFAHPQARTVRYPLPYGASARAGPEERIVHVHYAGKRVRLALNFASFESLLVHVNQEGAVHFEDLGYIPRPPRVAH